MKLVKIQVSDSTWEIVNSAKRPGESFDDALSRLLGELRSLRETKGGK